MEFNIGSRAISVGIVPVSKLFFQPSANKRRKKKDEEKKKEKKRKKKRKKERK